MAMLPLDGTRFAFDRLNGKSAKYRLGKFLDNGVGCIKATYDFSVQGGAVQNNLALLDPEGNAAKLPSGCIVLNAFVHVITACTSGGSATVDVEIEADADLSAAIAVASLAANASIQCIPDYATLSDAVRTTAERSIAIDINVAALTAGKFNVFVMYVQRG